MHFFITGHTGFKGSWLILMLRELGHEVSGLSLEPPEKSLFNLAELKGELKNHFIGDIRDLKTLRAGISTSQPDVAIHLAAQPLVLRSWEDPLETFTTNVDGTMNFLEATLASKAIKTSLVVTTDKVYKNESSNPCDESDPLGGSDPYSTSKAMADLLTQSWASAYKNSRLKIARAGNVIGAFDTSPNRLMPDLVRAVSTSKKVELRLPNAVRPWQHVLDCLWGYLKFIEQSNSGVETPLALNFGPEPSNFKTVIDLVDIVKSRYPSLRVSFGDSSPSSQEALILKLNSSRAERTLQWRNMLDFEDSVNWTLAELENKSLPPRDLVVTQIKTFLKIVESTSAPASTEK